MSEQSQDPHPWTRRGPSEDRPQGETSVAFEAFKVYLHMGADRTTRAVAEQVGKADSLIRRWSSTFDWPARAAAYDSYLLNASVDGEADQLAQVRNKHLSVAERLLDHLAESMSMWKPGHDPSIRWTQAFTAAAKVQQTALTLRETTNKGEEEVMERILAAFEKRAEG